MNKVTVLPPDWSAALGWLNLARAVRETPADISRKRRGGVDNRRNGVNVENFGMRKTSCATSTNRSGGSSR